MRRGGRAADGGGRTVKRHSGAEVLASSLVESERDSAGTQGRGAVRRQRWERLEGVGPRVLWDVAAGTGTTRRGGEGQR